MFIEESAVFTAMFILSVFSFIGFLAGLSSGDSIKSGFKAALMVPLVLVCIVVTLVGGSLILTKIVMLLFGAWIQ